MSRHREGTKSEYLNLLLLLPRCHTPKLAGYFRNDCVRTDESQAKKHLVEGFREALHVDKSGHEARCTSQSKSKGLESHVKLTVNFVHGESQRTILRVCVRISSVLSNL